MDSLPIPKLPGYIIDDSPIRRNGRTRTLEYKSGYSYVQSLEEESEIDKSRMFPSSREDAPLAASLRIPTTEEKFIPSYVTLDGKVLKFEAFLKDEIPDSQGDYSIRKFSVWYYLVDNSLKINEIKQENSGLTQGTFLKRHKVPRMEKDSRPKDFLTWRDIRVGEILNVYGREITITNCDKFTRDFYKNEGIEQGEQVNIPSDPYIMRRKAAEEKTTPKKDIDRRRRFLDFNRKVLRFYCMWDDRERLYGERRPFTLHFYLEDDTVEICEIHMPNDGRGSFSKMLRRQKLPVNSKEALQSIGHGPSEHYKDKDFIIGNKVDVFGREFFVYDCDDFTRSHFLSKYNITQPPPLTDRIRTPAAEPPARTIPPPTGFGSEEDSLACMYSLVPKQPKKDGRKLIEMQGKALRFLGKFEDPQGEEEMDRKFVISFFLADDTVSVFEPPQQNSGIVGGKFLERIQMKNPKTGKNYTAQDFPVGEVVEVNAFRFRILDCDNFTKKFLNNDETTVDAQLRKLTLHDSMKLLRHKFDEDKEAIRLAFLAYQDGAGEVKLERLSDILSMFHVDLAEEENEPLLRWFDLDRKGTVSFAGFCDAMERSSQFPNFLANMQMEKIRRTPVASSAGDQTLK